MVAVGFESLSCAMRYFGFLTIFGLSVITASCVRSAQYYLDRGNRLFEQKLYAEAALNYRKAIQKNRAMGEAYYRLGLASLKLGNATEAVQALTQAQTILPSRTDVKVSLSDVALTVYQANASHPKAAYDQVRHLSDELLKVDPKSADGLRLKGSLALLDRKPAEAAQLLQQANSIRPWAPEIVLPLTQALFQNKQFQPGEQMAVGLIEKHPWYEPIYEVLFLQYIAAKRPSDAEAILKRAVTNNPKSLGPKLQLARYYASQNRLDEAKAAALRPIEEHLNDYPSGLLALGDFYMQLGKPADAARYFEQGANKRGDDTLAYQKRLITAVIALGDRKKAGAIADAILKQHPDDAETLQSKSALLLQSLSADNSEAVLKQIEGLVQRRRSDPVLRYNFGMAHERAGQLDKARADYSEAARLAPRSAETRFALTSLALKQQNPAEALRLADELTGKFPDNPQARLLRSASLTALGRYDEARREINQVLAQSPNSPDARLQLGLIALGERKHNEATKIFQSLFESGNRDPRAVVGLAETFVAQNQLEKALAFLQDELKRFPGNDVARSLTAAIAIRLGQYDLGIQQYGVLKSHNPTSSEYPVLLGDVYRLTGDLKSAIASYRDAVARAPNDSVPGERLATTLQLADQLTAAEGEYRRTLRLNPQQASTLNNLAYLLARQGKNLEEALDLSQKAIKIDGKNPDFSDTLAVIYLKQGREDSALQVLEKLTKSYSNNPIYRYHLATALLGKGNKSRARAELTAALALKPDKGAEQEIRATLKGIE